MTNVVVLVYSEDDKERLREFVNDESNDSYIVSKYRRADWETQPKGMPIQSYVVWVADPKKEFEMRIKFETMPRLGVEFGYYRDSI